MELPHLGDNCALRECNQLDFLPVKCDACLGIFCIRHYRYESHQCSGARNKDNQVPACPLCSQPVVGRRDQLPDLAVSEHIDKYCKQNDQLKNKPLAKPKTNLQSCSFGRCKQKDVIYLECNDCRCKFCIKHRHPSDHSCQGPPPPANMMSRANWQSFKGSCSSNATSGYEILKNKAQQISKSGQAALNRMAQSGRTTVGGQQSSNSTRHTHPTAISSLQGNLTEQEALARALSESKSNNAKSNGAATRDEGEDEDLALARALHESQMLTAAQTRRGGAGANNKDSCVLS